MSDLEPITRSENFLNGTDLEPITREEHILAGEDLEPVTRHEWFLQKYRGSSVTVEALTVTDNGTYSEDDVAYSPVTVNVDKGLEIVDLDSADIVTFSDGLALPITSGKFYINAVQEGSGTPSTDNVRPITGFSSMDVVVTGNNLLPLPSLDNGWVDGYIRNTGTIGSQSSTNLEMTSDYRKVTGGENYTFTYSLSTSDTPWVAVGLYDKNKDFISRLDANSTTITATTTEDTVYVRVSIRTYGAVDWLQLEKGDTATTYEPYNGTTYSTTFSDTCYGGYVDSVNGKLVATWGNIESYDGETLTGAWLSSMDEYVEGATPTTGAQVVYELATATETTISIPTISTIEGTNNIYHNCNGETEVSVIKEA